MVWLDWVIGPFLLEYRQTYYTNPAMSWVPFWFRKCLTPGTWLAPSTGHGHALCFTRLIFISVWSLNFELRRYIESLSSNAHICTFANVTCCIHIAYILRQEDADVKLLLFCVWILINYQKKSRLIAAKFIVVTNFSIIFSISEERFSAEASWDLATLT